MHRRQQTQKQTNLPQTDHFVNKNNWPTNLHQAKEFANQAIDTFKYKNKKPMFRREVEQCLTVERVQFIIINALLSGEGLCTI